MARHSDTEYADFVDTAQRRLRSTAYLMTGDWHAAADLTQEALIRLYVAWPRLADREAAYAYTRRCLVNVVVDRSRRRSTRELATADVVPLGPGPVDPAGVVADRAPVVAALHQLGPRQRACVVLRFFDDLSVAQTAQALRCSEGTVKSQTARALAHLRDVLTIDLETDTTELTDPGRGSQR